MENLYVDIGTWRVNEYLNKQEIELDGCKLVGCYQKLPRCCTLASHAAIFVLLHNTPLITKPSEKITEIPGGGGTTSSTFNKARWQWRCPLWGVWIFSGMTHLKLGWPRQAIGYLSTAFLKFPIVFLLLFYFDKQEICFAVYSQGSSQMQV